MHNDSNKKHTKLDDSELTMLNTGTTLCGSGAKEMINADTNTTQIISEETKVPYAHWLDEATTGTQNFIPKESQNFSLITPEPIVSNVNTKKTQVQLGDD